MAFGIVGSRNACNPCQPGDEISNDQYLRYQSSTMESKYAIFITTRTSFPACMQLHVLLDDMAKIRGNGAMPIGKHCHSMSMSAR